MGAHRRGFDADQAGGFLGGAAGEEVVDDFAFAQAQGEQAGGGQRGCRRTLHDGAAAVRGGGAGQQRGVGFDPRETAEGVGMRAVRERTALRNGRLEVLSEPAGGTTVRLRVPRFGTP